MSNVDISRKRNVEHAFSKNDDAESSKPSKRSRAERGNDARQVQGSSHNGDTELGTRSGRRKRRAKASSEHKHQDDTPPTLNQKVETHEQIVKKKRKKNRKAAGKGQGAEDQLALELENSLPRQEADRHKTKRENLRASSKVVANAGGNRVGDLDDSSWKITGGVGGLFLDHDPLLTRDEKYLILPTRAAVNIYATRTSLLVRSLRPQDGNYVSCCSFSQSDENQLFITSEDGHISKWNWSTGELLLNWAVPEGLVQIKLCSSDSSNVAEEVLALHETMNGRRWVYYTLKKGNDGPSFTKTILKRQGLSKDMLVLDDGHLLVTTAGQTLFIGRKAKTKSDQVGDVTYTWRELTMPNSAASLDVCLRSISKSSTGSRESIDVAVGFADGTIQIYDDLLFRLIGKEKNNANAEVTSKRLHWHRNTVKALKWSKDGNYVISGGFETVLVIWQIDTNQQQFLPHLSAAILNLTISAAGTSYVLRLADNSVMVLSVADLLPSANIQGPAVLPHGLSGVVAAVHTAHKDKAFIATATSLTNQLGLSDTAHATMLQIYDWRTGLQTGKQALARNMTTDKNVDPRGHLVQEPNVVFMAFSQDGQWLATVDEWQPHPDDLAVVSSADGHIEIRETCIKFWSLGQSSENWELVTRVDEPHGQNVACCGLFACPTRLEFATTGANAQLKIWAPKLRQRDGVAVRDSAGRQLSTWTVRLATEVKHNSMLAQSSSHRVAGAYSADGSVLAISWDVRGAQERLVHFIDPRNGYCISQEQDLLSHGKASMGFVGRFLITLSSSLHVWDTISRRTWLQLNLAPAYRASAGNILATNSSAGHFAIAVRPLVDGAGYAHVAVFDVQARTCLHRQQSKDDILALLSVTNETSYLLVDASGEISRLANSRTSAQSLAQSPVQAMPALRNLTGIFAPPGVVSASTTPKSASDLSRNTQAKGMQSSEHLFGISSTFSRQPTVQETFFHLANLFAKRSTIT